MKQQTQKLLKAALVLHRNTPPAIARLALLDKLPDFIESAIKHQMLALAAMRQCRKVTAVANEAKHNFEELVAWLRSIGADDNYLRMMEKRLCDGLVAAEAESIEITRNEQAQEKSEF
jgi:hypothetical protein